MDMISEIVGTVNGYVWGWPMLVLILGAGLFLTVGLRFLTIMKIPFGFSLLWKGRIPGDDAGDISPFNALMTSLSATIGTGNIAGVATAIFLSGPGAVFWMWMTALVGMGTKYAEAVCAVRFRETDENGNFVGDPMYYIQNGLGAKWKWLAVILLCSPGSPDLALAIWFRPIQSLMHFTRILVFRISKQASLCRCWSVRFFWAVSSVFPRWLADWSR